MAVAQLMKGEVEGHFCHRGAVIRRPALMQVSEEDILEAERVAQETKQAMRSILKGIILILPALPFPQPPQG